MGDIVFPAVERRSFAFDDIEVREEAGSLRFDGIAAVTDRWSEDLGGFIERLAPGAFRKLLTKPHDVRFLVDHDPSKVLARSTISEGPGSLVLKEEARGLRARAVFSNTSVARDTAQLVRDGVVSQMSFAWPYGAAKDSIEETDTGLAKRTIHEFTALRDVSAVSYPAYRQTTASMRSLECGVDLSLEELRRLAGDIHTGRVIATEEERLLIDEAFARIDLLSPWMEERARRVLGVTAERTADQGAEDDGTVDAPVGEQEPVLVSAAARERRLSIRSIELRGA